MKVVYFIIFIISYVFLMNTSKTPEENYSIFLGILFIPSCIFIAWAIPQLFKDAIVPFFNWLAKFIPKSGD